MRVARLQISGFRGIRQADIRLGETSVLIGPNNVGKTTIIEALALVLGRDGMVRSLTEHDFFGSDPKPADRIKIIVTIIGFAHRDPARLPEWFSIRRGVPKWFDPGTGTESATQRDAPFELACEIGFQARFDHTNLEVETCRYFLDDPSIDDVFVDDVVTSVSLNLLRDIGLFLIPASRSWDRMISFGSELFRRVVSSDSGLPAESILAERDKLRAPADPLENDARLKPVIDEVNKEITSLFGVSSDVRLRLTATDSASVLDAVVPHFSTGSLTIPARRQGSGLISLQSLFLLLHFGKRRVESGKGFCLALEEPELHLPPTIQRRVLRRLSTLSSQVLVSTHSPLVASFSEPADLRVVSNDNGVLAARAVLDKPLTAATPNAIRALYQIRRVETVTALMAEAVLVPEGIFDFEWFILLSKVVELHASTDAVGASFCTSVGVVPTQSGAVVESARYLSLVHPKIMAIVDGDTAGQGYARQLLTSGPRLTLRWPDGWTIEDVIGWICQPAESSILAQLAREMASPPQSLAELVTRLKNDDVKDPLHLKGDRIAYEGLAGSIGEQPACVSRAEEVLNAIAQLSKSGTTPRFVRDQSSVFVFQP